MLHISNEKETANHRMFFTHKSPVFVLKYLINIRTNFECLPKL